MKQQDLFSPLMDWEAIKIICRIQFGIGKAALCIDEMDRF